MTTATTAAKTSITDRFNAAYQGATRVLGSAKVTAHGYATAGAVATAAYAGRACKGIESFFSKAWAYTKKAVTFLGIDAHTATIGAAAAAVAGAVVGYTGAATLLGATAAVAGYASLIAIPMMALYLVLNKSYRKDKGWLKGIFGAMNAATLVPFAVVYGAYYVAKALAYAGVYGMTASNMGAAFLVL
ncbi:hypothetical protein [Paenibacillus sp. UNC496MF]|uniref:hypothetical protein n=1 Tax=Paenibacillus sp. UNC496MF TaxID=1502753 RepID=UPI000B884E18|nr:hypothetical protein [Paenibacillus sp. UNC496MF]